MAKDGTNRGGARVGAGRKPKSVEQRTLEGRTARIVTMDGAEQTQPRKIRRTTKLDAWMSEPQFCGKEFLAKKIAAKTWRWLEDRGCAGYVTEMQVANYAAAQARYIQCQQYINDAGFLATHPTTGVPITSPFVAMADMFVKQAQAAWYAIYQTIKDHCSEVVGEKDDDSFSGLLSG